MTLKGQMAQDGHGVFLNTDEFAEEITYTAEGVGSRVIRAIVVRYELAPAEENINRL